MPYKILVLESDAAAGDRVAQGLKPEFEADSSRLALQTLDRLRRERPDLLVVDLDLADMEGMAFLRVLRETDSGRGLSVIALSAKKGEDTVTQAFELGVDDFMEKPFDIRELMARARTVLRRRFERLERHSAALTLGAVSIEPSQRRCVVKGKRVALQPREFELLEILMRKAGRVLTRPYLLETVWGMSHTADTRAVDVDQPRPPQARRPGQAHRDHLQDGLHLRIVYRGSQPLFSRLIIGNF
jgi:DNA-binding response OmpR family regulator